MYHLIDEKRRLYACNVAEITLEDSYCILQSWGGEHSLSEVLVFYSVTQNAVVINENCKDFNQKEGLIPRSLLRNKLFQDMEEEIY